MRTPARLTSLRARCHAVLFMVLTRLHWYGNTQIGCCPRWASMIDQAMSFKIATCGRLVLNASRGITKTLRPTSGTGTSQLHSEPQTLLSRKPVLTAKKTIQGESRRQFGKELVLLIPSDGVGWTGG